MRVKERTPILAGLAVAWGGPALLTTAAGDRLGEVWGLAAMWALLAIVMAIVTFWEKRPPASLGLRRFSWRSIAWGLLLAAVTIYAIVPLLTWALGKAGIPAFEAGMAKVLVLPRWLRAVAVGVFAFLHLPHWGIGPALAYLVAVGIALAFFCWRRDLLANIVAHVTVDGLGLLLG